METTGHVSAALRGVLALLLLLACCAGAAIGAKPSMGSALPGGDCAFCGNCSNHNAVRPPSLRPQPLMAVHAKCT
jgi:hypothetical protein